METHLVPEDGPDPMKRDLTQEINKLHAAFLELGRGEEITCSDIANLTGLERFTIDWKRTINKVRNLLLEEGHGLIKYAPATAAWRIVTKDEQLIGEAQRRRRSARRQLARIAAESSAMKPEELTPSEQRLAAFNVFHAQDEGKRIKNQETEFRKLTRELGDTNQSAARRAIEDKSE